MFWQAYLAQTWSTAWDHYKKGGGVYIYDQLNTPEMELALGKFKEHSRLSPISISSRNYSGTCLIYLERYEEAMKEFNSSLSIWSNFTAHYQKAYIYKTIKNYPNMIKSLESALDHESNFGSEVRFNEEFFDVKNHPSMFKFQDQYKD